MSVTLTGSENDFVSDKLPNKQYENDCDELFCTVNLNLHYNDDNVSFSNLNVSDVSDVSVNCSESFDNNVFNHNQSMSCELSVADTDNSLNNVCGEAGQCQSFTENSAHQGSAFSELRKFRVNHSKQIVIGHLNINSLRNKFCEIYDILLNELIDVFGLSETKLDSSFTSSQFSVPDYTMHRVDRNSHGGGILFYVKSAIPHRTRKDLSCSKESRVETLVIEIKLRKEKIMVVLVYKPPNVSNDVCIDQLGMLLDKCYMECKSVYILGDLNINFLNLPGLVNQFMNQYGLTNLVEGHTCYKNAQNPSLIDVFLSNTPARISAHLNVSVGISDFHNLICAATRIHAPIQMKRKITYRSFKKFNEQKFNDDLEKVPLHVCNVFDDIDDVMWSFNHLLSEVVDAHAPVKTKLLKKPQLPYMNGQLRKAINVKGMLRRKFNKCNDQINWDRYRKQRNLVTSLKRKSLKEYFNQRCNKPANGKQFWNTVRPFMSDNQKANSSISLLEHDTIISKPSEVCEILNEHFINIANDLSEPIDVMGKSVNAVLEFYKNHPSIVNIKAADNDNDVRFKFSKVTPDEVFKEINKLKTGKACGYDKIPAKILRSGTTALCIPLANIINRCIDDAVFPDHCKHAVVSAVYKKNDCLKKDNYRPVSVLTALSKVFESITCEQLMAFFKHVMSHEISAYRQMYSTNNVILKCIEEWKSAFDDKMVVGCVAMDLSKAFDSIPHNLLIAKLYAYGISYNSCKLVKSYLSDRMQCVKLNDNYSKWQCIQRGVPQGSLMGPILFNVYINDLLLLLQNFSSVFNYADDNTLSFCHKDIDVVKQNLKIACELSIVWFKTNFMKVNAEKFQFMVLNMPNNTDMTLKISSSEIKATDNMKLLGVNLDSSLCFDSHIEGVITQASRQINVLSRLSKVLNSSCKLKILDAFILSNFNYCCLAYHHCRLGDARKLEMLLKRALRFVYLDFSSTYKELLCKAEKSCLYVNRLRTMLLTVYKIVHGICPPIGQDFFKVQDLAYNLRCSNVLVQPAYNSKRHGFNSLKYQGASLWNKISDDVKNVDFNTFKNFVRKWQPECRCGNCILCTI